MKPLGGGPYPIQEIFGKKHENPTISLPIFFFF
jgi:hypothetical protein